MFRGTWTCWKNAQPENAGADELKSSLAEKDLLILVRHEAEVRNAPLWHGAPTASWATLGEAFPAGRER